MDDKAIHTKEEEINTNIDNPNRHNVGGAMNRPVRNADPLSPRNIIKDEVVEEWQHKFSFPTEVHTILFAIEELLIDKNRKYGNSALDPKRVFSKADAVEQIKVRIDDKLSRIANQVTDEDEDVIDDLIGYLVLLKIAHKRKL